MLQAESHSPAANITKARDAVWQAIVTIATVGYGDFYPVTPVGRGGRGFRHGTGIGTIGSLVSILASLLMSTGPASGAPGEMSAEPTAVEARLASVELELRGAPGELAEVRRLLEGRSVASLASAAREPASTDDPPGAPA